MKKSVLALSLLTLMVAANEPKSELGNELEWVEEQVKSIKPKRDGISNKELSSLRSPFIFLKKNMIKEESKKSQVSNKTQPSIVPKITDPIKSTSDKKKEDKLYVHAIINNSALIGSKWYKVNARVKGYKIKSIDFKSVTLIKNNKELVLTTHTTNSNIKFNNK